MAPSQMANKQAKGLGLGRRCQGAACQKTGLYYLRVFTQLMVASNTIAKVAPAARLEAMPVTVVPE